MKKKIIWCITAIALSGIDVKAQISEVPQEFFGLNGWMNEKVGSANNNYNCHGLSLAPTTPCYLYGEFDKPLTGIVAACPSKVKNLNTRLIRYGGNANDINKPTNDQYINEIDRIRSLGAEPIIQISYGENYYTSAEAYNLIYYLNVTRGKKIKYVAIGNEPDLYASYRALTSDQAKAEYIAGYFRSFSEQVKSVDANIKIIGPGNAFYYSPVYSKLLDINNTTGNIVGVSNSNNSWLDIVDFHYYPYAGTQSLSSVIGNPRNTLSDHLTDAINNDGLLDYMDAANANRTTSLQFAVSELNINYMNPTSNTITGTGANGFLAGQWMAESYSVIMEKGKNTSSTLSKVAFVAPWSFHESSGNAGGYDLGIMSSSTPCTTPGAERSTYHHMAMMGQYFKGIYYTGTDKNSSNADITNVKAFGSYLSGGYYAIMIINEDAYTNYSSYTINTDASTTSTSALRINMGISGTNRSYTYSSGIAAKTTHLVILDCGGVLVKIIKYDETDEINNSGPSTLDVGGGTSPITLSISSVNTACNSSNGSATVSASGGTGTYTYSWAPTGYTGGTTSAYSALPAGTYTVTVSNTSCTGTLMVKNCYRGKNRPSCAGAVKAIVTIGKASPAVTIASNGTSCASAATFTASVSGGASPYAYSWSGGLGTSAISSTSTRPDNNTATAITVTVTDNTGCVNTANASHYGLPTVTISGDDWVGACCPVVLTATSIPGASYSWTSSTAIGVLGTSRTLNGKGPGIYTVVVTPNYPTFPCSAVSAQKTVNDNSSSCCSGRTEGAKVPVNNILSNETSEIQFLVSNSSADQVSVYYSLVEANTQSELHIINVYGQIVGRYELNAQSKKTDVDCSTFANGIYFTSLITNDQIVSTKKLIITK